MRKKRGFTLAETLITLAIIGIIAAMTVPNLISKIDKETRLSQFKAGYKLLQELAMLSYNENGYPPKTTETALTASQLFDIYYRPYLKIAKDCGFNTQTGSDRCFAAPQGGFYDLNGSDLSTAMYGASNFYKVILQNGMSLGVVPAQQSNFFSSAIFVIDIDGPSKGYSKMGQDVFYFSYIDSRHYGNGYGCQNIAHVPAVVPGGLCFYQYPYMCSNLFANIGGCDLNSQTSTGRPAGANCSVKIIKNGLQYPNNYPWTLVNKRPEGFVKFK